ncbi:bromodomain-containing protein 7 [Phlebotomus argentipes]|uniref:bromodomain-containing protein 7 n=1 Tax=Phlebotomus argentipes TaxID=94469 RepID=UPI002892BBBF|nr:bromodomain-containing protein 7 [Phlebotomus argentipes]
MGSKKHKKHKSERRERYEDPNLSPGRPPSLKLILKVGSNSTPEYGNDSPAYGVQNDQYLQELHERHKKSKKKKKKKDREKKHKHHHKEKRRHRDDSSFDDMSIGEDSQMQDSMMRYGGVSKGLAHLRSPESISSQEHNSSGSMQSPHGPKLHQEKPATVSDGTGREPRQCVLKLKQSRSPLAKILDHLLRSLEKRDPHQFFAWPVTNDIAPGYSAIITKPMDFSTMRQKIDENAYTTIQEFGDDFRLMCENAIKYNHVETVYHKAAKRLLHVGARMLQPENLMRSLRSFMVYMRELTPKELGFELPNSENHDTEQCGGDSADEETSTGAEENVNVNNEEDVKRKPMRQINNPKSRFEPFMDDMSAEEVLAQVQKAARSAKSRVFTRQRAHKMGFLRQHKDGTTSMKILLDSEGNCTGQERLISLGAFTGRLKQGTGQIQGIREDRRNLAKAVKPLNYGAFSSFAPVFDSRFANLSKEESQLVLSTYGDDTGTQYAESILEFTKSSSYASSLANGLLDVLTGGEHRKTLAKITESHRQRSEKEEVEKSFPDPDPPTKTAELAAVKVDFDALRSLTDLGIDVKFVDQLERMTSDVDNQKRFQTQLNLTSNLLEKLHQVQFERLSQPPPMHLSQVQQPGSDEMQLATQITSNIAEMAKNLPPEAITTPHALRKAMGVSTAGLEPYQMQRVSLVGNVQGVPRLACDISPDMDITPVPMEIEPDSLVHHQNHNHANVDNTTPVDLETELREFLEGGSSSEVEHDTSSIEQMLLN